MAHAHINMQLYLHTVSLESRPNRISEALYNYVLHLYSRTFAVQAIVKGYSRRRQGRRQQGAGWAVPPGILRSAKIIDLHIPNKMWEGLSDAHADC